MRNKNHHNNNKMYVLSVSTIMTILILAVSLAYNKNLVINSEKIKCIKCGNTINLSSKFCKKCGVKIVS